MTKLDEIEKLIYTREDLQHDEEPVYLKQDVDLLIRAVRQLGAAADISDLIWAKMAGSIDPDVLELLESEEG